MRLLIQQHATEENTSQILEGILTGMLDGEFPQGLGKNTWKVIDNTEPRFRQICREVEAAKKKKALAENKQTPEGAADDGSSGGIDDAHSHDPEVQAAIEQSLKAQPGGRPDSATAVPSADVGTSPEKSSKKPAPRPVLTATSVAEQETLLADRAKAPAAGLMDEIAKSREKLSNLKKGKGEGYPHVFNKIYPALFKGLDDVLEGAKIYCKDTSATRAILDKVDQLQKEFETKYREHLVAFMPPTNGPDENSLAFGSESKGLL